MNLMELTFARVGSRTQHKPRNRKLKVIRARLDLKLTESGGSPVVGEIILEDMVHDLEW
jgi:hypothetical protein